LATIGKKPTDEEIEGQILLNISEKSFTLYHSDNYDAVAVYLILAAALEHLAEAAENQVNSEAKYLQ
jgi:hypothetical protein